MASIHAPRTVGDHRLASTSLCRQKTAASSWIDVTLIIGFVALLIIGILATAGVLDCIGTTNAVYLSYGMYAGAALFILANIVKVAVNRCSSHQEHASKAALTHKQIERFKKYCAEEKKHELDEYVLDKSDPINDFLVKKIDLQIQAIIKNTIFQNDPVNYLTEWLNQYLMLFNEFKNADRFEAVKVFKKTYAQYCAKCSVLRVKNLKDCGNIFALDSLVFVVLGQALQKLKPVYAPTLNKLIVKINELMEENILKQM